MSRPAIRAAFRLDDKGDPEIIQRDNASHYRIILSVENTPHNTYAVTYMLHETYYDPVRESRNRDTHFAEEITSYGDFVIQAKIRTRDNVETLAALLSALLERSYSEKRSQKIETALRDIREH